jgi:hypothetical protein
VPCHCPCRGSCARARTGSSRTRQTATSGRALDTRTWGTLRVFSQLIMSQSPVPCGGRKPGRSQPQLGDIRTSPREDDTMAPPRAARNVKGIYGFKSSLSNTDLPVDGPGTCSSPGRSLSSARRGGPAAERGRAWTSMRVFAAPALMSCEVRGGRASRGSSRTLEEANSPASIFFGRTCAAGCVRTRPPVATVNFLLSGRGP